MLLLLAPKLPRLFSSRSHFKRKDFKSDIKAVGPYLVPYVELKVHFMKSVGKLLETNLQQYTGDTAQFSICITIW